MPAQVIDLFCGVGGLTRGLLDAGLDVVSQILGMLMLKMSGFR